MRAHAEQSRHPSSPHHDEDTEGRHDHDDGAQSSDRSAGEPARSRCGCKQNWRLALLRRLAHCSHATRSPPLQWRNRARSAGGSTKRRRAHHGRRGRRANHHMPVHIAGSGGCSGHSIPPAPASRPFHVVQRRAAAYANQRLPKDQPQRLASMDIVSSRQAGWNAAHKQQAAREIRSSSSSSKQMSE